MSESAEKTSTPGDTLLHAGIYQRLSDDDSPRRDPTTNTSAQILLEALQNFVLPLVNAASGEIRKDISQVPLGLEAGKLLTALQEFISSIIMQSRVGQPRGIDVDLIDDAKAESPGVATDSTVSDPGPLKTFIGTDFPLEVMYQRVMRKIPEAVREHVFSGMPIRLLHFTNIPRSSDSEFQITLIDRNGVCGRVIERIQADYSKVMFRRRVESIKGFSWLDEPAIEGRVVAELVRENTKYAILSHTWLRGSDAEVTYRDWQVGQFDIQQPGYQKLANFCKSAWKDHGLSFGWMDTICINKDSSSELDESIRSMYKWYESSDVCITYLAGSLALGEIYRDPWFTRGWTFQELLAPKHMTFYGKDWKKFVQYTHPGDKKNVDILGQIHKATTITTYELRHPDEIPISRKMQLAARRKVMREEDTAYSLMGICDVSISIAYGEGAQRAFFRLMTEILNASRVVVDIFNCAQTGGFSGSTIIPSAPSAYLSCSKEIMEMPHDLPIEPLLLTHIGLRMSVLLMPSLKENDLGLKKDTIGDYYARIHLPALHSEDIGCYHLLDKGVTKSTLKGRRMFGILNFGGYTANIFVPARCLAVCFNWSGQVEWDSTSPLIDPIRTKEPIVFHLMNRKIPTSGDGRYLYSLKRNELAKHGITLTTMYL